MDLFQAAAENAPRLEQRLDDLRGRASAGSRDALEVFLQCVHAHGKVSINLRPSTLLAFLVEGRYQNIYDWARAQAQWSSKSAEDLLRDRLGTWYERRVAFDRSFDEGERLRYGALNLGGMGPKKYGSFCMIVSAMPPGAWSGLVFLPADSLTTYAGPSGALDSVGIGRDAGPHSHRMHVAGLKHETAIHGIAEADWPELVCSDDGYVEAVFVGDLTPGDLAAVRMPRREYELYFDYAFEDVAAKLAEADRVLIEVFRLILQQLKSRKIRWEVI